MDLINFALDGQNIGLEWPPNNYADLHNNFKFELFEYSPTKALLKLSWRKSTGSWARNEPRQTLQLVFEGVNYLRVQERDSAYPISEDETLQHICRTPPEARDEFENIYFNEDAQPHYDMLLYFQSEWGLGVNAATVRLVSEAT